MTRATMYASILVMTTMVTPAVRADLAPSGTLRAGVNYGNFILATKDPASGSPAAWRST